MVVAVLPAGRKPLRTAATGFVEPGVAEFSVAVGEHQAAGGFHGLFCLAVHLSGDALVALAVVVGTDIVMDVVVVVPNACDYLFARSRFGEFQRLFYGITWCKLSEHPAARDDGVGLQQFGMVGGSHLAGDDAFQIGLHVHIVDGMQHPVFGGQSESSEEGLVLALLPVKLLADDDTVKGERTV